MKLSVLVYDNKPTISYKLLILSAVAPIYWLLPP